MTRRAAAVLAVIAGIAVVCWMSWPAGCALILLAGVLLRARAGDGSPR